MKKLALLLAAMTAVSAVASAKEIVAAPVVAIEPVAIVCPETIKEVQVKVVPDFRITNARVRLVTENRSGARDISDSGQFRLETNYAYGKDWTGFLNVRRYFTSNSDEDNGSRESLYNKGALRTYVGATRNNLSFMNIPYSFGMDLQLRQDRDYYGMTITPRIAPWLGLYGVYNYVATSTSGNNDDHYFEGQITLRHAGFGLSYYHEYLQEVGNSNEDYTNSQVRLTTPTWKVTPELGLSFEGRSYIQYDANDVSGDPVYKVATTTRDAFDVNRVYLHSTYKLNETMELRGSLYYEFGKWQHNSKKDTKNSYMNGVDVSVIYKF